MDLFEAYPQLKACTDPVLAGRKVRLISVAALVCDGEACYLEFSAERYWVRDGAGAVHIGVGGVQLAGTPAGEPLRALLAQVRRMWRLQVEYFPTGTLYVLEGDRYHVLPGATLTEPTTPLWLQLTPPRLGGGDMPDALAQAVYGLRLRSPWRAPREAQVLKVTYAGLDAFFAQPTWSIAELRAQPWATFYLARPLPVAAHLRPVLALQGLRQLRAAGVPLLPLTGSAPA